MSYWYNANGELTSVTGSSNYGQTYIYDDDGNTKTVSGTGGTSSATYTWDPRGRMIGAAAGGNTVSDQYNDSDERISETVNGQTTTFLNDPNQAYDQVLEEYAQGGMLAATYIRGIDLLFEDQSGVLSYYVSDNLGSTRAVPNSAGGVTDTYNYDAYGDLIASTGTTEPRSQEWLGALHSVSVWASELGLLLGQVACAEKSNEIAAIPELPRLVDIKGAIITIDAPKATSRRHKPCHEASQLRLER